jgi:hypothetical protein
MRLTLVRKSLLVATATAALTLAAGPVQATSLPSGERYLGNAAQGHGAVIEPAYDLNTGALTYILTPTGAPNPSKANAHAVAPLYIVVYPASYPGWTLAASPSTAARSRRRPTGRARPPRRVNSGCAATIRTAQPPSVTRAPRRRP